MFEYKNVNTKKAALILFSCLLMSSAHAMICADVEVDENIRNARPLAIVQKTYEVDSHITNLIELHKAAKKFFEKAEEAFDSLI